MTAFRSLGRARARRALALGASSVGVLAVVTSTGPVEAQPVATATPSCATMAGSADWPTQRHDMARTGANAGETTLAPSNVSQLVSVARLPVSHLVWSEPVVAGNRAYIAATNSRLFAASASSLTLRWQTPLAVHPGGADYDGASPTCAGGGLFATAEDSNQAASLDPVDGSRLWRQSVSTQGDVVASPAVDGGSVFVASRAGELTALNAATGAVIWRVAQAHDITVGDLWSTPAAQNGTVYFGAEKLFAYDEASGRLLLAAPFRDSGDYTVAPPVLYGNAVLVDSDDAVTSFDPTSGAIRWSYPLVRQSSIPLAAADGRVFAVQGLKSIVALSARTGRKLWEFTAPTRQYASTSAPVYANGVVYVPGPEHFYALDASTGAVLWTSSGFDFESPLSVTVAEGTIYTVDYANGVHAWRLGTGHPGARRVAGARAVSAAARLRLLRARAAARLALR